MRRIFIACSAMALMVAMMAGTGRGRQEQQDKSKRPSPAAHAEFQFADAKTIIMDYSSPRAKGRKIFGGLVPYGQVWRAGANEAHRAVNPRTIAPRAHCGEHDVERCPRLVGLTRASTEVQRVARFRGQIDDVGNAFRRLNQ